MVIIMDVSPDTKLNNSQTAQNYKSIHSERQDADTTRLQKEVPLKQLASGTPDLDDRSTSFFRELDKDPPPERPCLLEPWKNGVGHVYAGSIIAIVTTLALLLELGFGQRPVFLEGTVVTDHERCSKLGQGVLRDRGSSVDAAIVATLCLGVVHPHTSGIGGGGVMLVHDIQTKGTKVIHFLPTAPSAIEETSPRTLWLNPGLQVGVPGVVRGLRQAHSMFGRLSWKQVIARAVDVARNGFNVSESLADAISKVKSENVSEHFKDTFFPGHRSVSAGSFMALPKLATALESGLTDFYTGKLRDELIDTVRVNGGVLSEADMADYNADVGEPVQGFYHGFQVLVPPPPSAGAAVILTLNLLKAFHLDKNKTARITNNWIAESLRAAHTMAGILGDPRGDLSISDLLGDMLRRSQGNMSDFWPQVDSLNTTSKQVPTVDSFQSAQVVVMGSDEMIVTVASSLGGTFGSRIVTPSGVLLNSHVLDFSWPGKAQIPEQKNQRNRIRPGKRPVSFLMPAIVLPSQGRCGKYVAVSSPDGDHSLGAVTQVLMNVLLVSEGKNESASAGNRHSNGSDGDEAAWMLHQQDHVLHGPQVLPLVQGLQRRKDIIEIITELPSSDGL